MVPLDATALPLANPELHQATLEGSAPSDVGPPGLVFPPVILESDEPNLESDLHREQIDLLIRLLKYWWRDRKNFYIAGNLTVYYSAQETRKRDFRGPDIFVVMGADARPRKSWVVWEEDGRYPDVVIEMLSDSTASVDRSTKKTLYQKTWRLPEYFWFDPETHELAGFRLIKGQYEAIQPDADGRLLSEQLGLKLGLHEQILRWFTLEGELIPFPEEVAEQAKEQAQLEKEQAEQAKEQAQLEKEQAQLEKEQAEQAKEQAQLEKEQAQLEKEQVQQEKEQVQQQLNQERLVKEQLEAYLRSQGIDPNHLPSFDTDSL